VTYRTLTSQQQVDGTLGYSGSYSIVNRASGTLTSLPSTGQVVRQGHVLYRVDTSPVVLLYGSTPAYRDLTEGDSGPDVRSLNADLVALGDASSASLDPTSDYFGAATAAAVDTLQANLGVSQTGTLTWGQVVFAPGPVRVTSVNGIKGTPAQAGAVVLQATSTTRQVTVNLDAAQQSYVKAGDQVTITLADQAATAGTVTSVSSVATSGSSAGGSSSSGSSGSNSATVQVTIALRDPGATGTLDQAPVQVAITTATAPDVLTVPVTALLAQPGGGYAVDDQQKRRCGLRSDRSAGKRNENERAAEAGKTARQCSQESRYTKQHRRTAWIIMDTEVKHADANTKRSAALPFRSQRVI